MIKSAAEFIRLRMSEEKDEYHRAAHDMADISTWNEIIEKYPDYKQWVIHNKTVPIEILEILILDADPTIRSMVARKRKINDTIFRILSQDKDENVRYALICNTALNEEKLKQIHIADSDWLTNQMKERLMRIDRK